MYILVRIVRLRLRQANTERAMDLTDKQIFFYTSILKLLGTYNYYYMKTNYQIDETENKFVIYFQPSSCVHETHP